VDKRKSPEPGVKSGIVVVGKVVSLDGGLIPEVTPHCPNNCLIIVAGRRDIYIQQYYT
jgi:hypothetical protein